MLPPLSQAADTDAELQQLIGQAEQMLTNSGSSSTENISALSTALEGLKSALADARVPKAVHDYKAALHAIANDGAGLALAGANLDAQGDGVLTALEASSLNLWGTRLVSLSGCDTGLGEVRNGEGVYGLRRAFVLAGTETLVMSLWPVGDGVAREMMTTYYASLRAGLGRGDALRRAKLAIRQGPGHVHPFYWASFIQSGEWAGLDGKR